MLFLRCSAYQCEAHFIWPKFFSNEPSCSSAWERIAISSKLHIQSPHALHIHIMQSAMQYPPNAVRLELVGVNGHPIKHSCCTLPVPPSLLLFGKNRKLFSTATARGSFGKHHRQCVGRQRSQPTLLAGFHGQDVVGMCCMEWICVDHRA